MVVLEACSRCSDSASKRCIFNGVRPYVEAFPHGSYPQLVKTIEAYDSTLPVILICFNISSHLTLIVFMNQVRFSAIVVTFNEERRLPECLSSLKYCDEIFAIDLGSTDRSRQIAEQCGAKVLSHPKVSIGEHARHVGYEASVNDWVFVVDPDEVVEKETFSLAIEAINANPKLAVIRLPMQNYFLGKALLTTIWGVGEANRIVHRRRIRLVKLVHDSNYALPGYDTVTLSSPRKLLRHYWVDSFAQMFEKHLRYIKLEGEARFDKGERFSIRRCCRALRDSFKSNFIQMHGWKGGWRGWFLSIFHVWYTLGAWLSLRRFQNNRFNKANKAD
jgi:glycosyltransferase involved in cell wall biosynthesis